MSTLTVRTKSSEPPSPTIAQALEAFRAKMVQSNCQFINLFLDRLLQTQPRNDEVALNYFARFYWKLDTWSETGYGSDSLAPISRPEEIRDLLPRIAGSTELDGTLPPKDERTRQDFLNYLEQALNDQADNSIYSEPLVVPEDYKALLALTDGVYDPDFRKANVSEFCGVQIPQEIKNRVRQLRGMSFLIDWQIAGGWQTGIGSEGDSDCHYTYCRNIDVEAPESESSWAWRIWYMVSELDVLDAALPYFVILNGIVPFLDWYSDWYARTNIERSINWKLRRLSEDSQDFEESKERRDSLE